MIRISTLTAWWRNREFYPLVIMALLTPGAVALASESGGGHSLPSFGEYLTFLVPYWVNFLIFAGGLVLLLRKPSSQMWASRRETIQSAIAQASQALATSQEKLSAAREKLNSLAEDITRQRAQTEHQTVEDCSRILQEAEQRAQRMRQQAQETAVAERRAAEKSIQARIIEEAAGLARQKLSAEIAGDVDRSYRQKAAGAVQELVQ